MSVLKLTNGFARLSDADLVNKAQSINLALTGNIYYPEPDPALTDFTLAINEFNNAVLQSKSGNIVERKVKDQKRVVLIDLMHELADYVIFAAKGDEAVALSSNYNISKPPSPSPALEKATDIVLTDGVNSGELQMKAKRVAGARSYMFQYTQDNPLVETATWESIGTTRAKIVFQNLAREKQYYCRVAAVGVNNQMVYSDVFSRVVQ